MCGGSKLMAIWSSNTLKAKHNAIIPINHLTISQQYNACMGGINALVYSQIGSIPFKVWASLPHLYVIMNSNKIINVIVS